MNRRPADYESAALPIELLRPASQIVSLRSAAVKFHAENLSPNPFPASYSHEEIMMDLSLELAFRIAIVWAAGFILAVAVQIGRAHV